MNRVAVKPELLRWARERARRSAESLRGRFPKLKAWERGEVHPTLKQLESFARATHVPVGYLFLPEPPVEEIPIPDFRTVSDAQPARRSPDMLDTIYLCQQRQHWYRDHARSMGEEPLGFVGSVKLSADTMTTAASIRDALGFDVDRRGGLPTWTDALRSFIEQVDTLGVLVMVSGVVGSNNRRHLDPEEFRGFALADPLAPLIFINGADTKAAQMFTLAHELRDEVDRLARCFKVSTLVILRRLRDAGWLTADESWSAYEAELTRLRALPKGSGGNFYWTLGARVGKRFARALLVSTLEGRTSFTESFRLLGIKKLSTFHDVAQAQAGIVARPSFARRL